MRHRRRQANEQSIQQLYSAHKGITALWHYFEDNKDVLKPGELQQLKTCCESFVTCLAREVERHRLHIVAPDADHSDLYAKIRAFADKWIRILNVRYCERETARLIAMYHDMKRIGDMIDRKTPIS